MKYLLMIGFIALTICGCRKDYDAPREIWHGGRTILETIWRQGGTPLEKVETPPGFTVTPIMAISNGCHQLGHSKQVPVLWANGSNYYFTYGFGEKALRRAVAIKGRE